MIDRLKVECQEYEQTIVDQHREISELKIALASQNFTPQRSVHKTASQVDELELKNLVKRLQSEVKTLTE
jgi:hypothetical protein